MPLSVFLSSEVGSADGFCLSEPVPSWLSFEGLSTVMGDGVELLVFSPELLTPPAALVVDDVVDVEVAAPATPADDEVAVLVGDDEEPAMSAEGDLIDAERPEPLGV